MFQSDDPLRATRLAAAQEILGLFGLEMPTVEDLRTNINYCPKRRPWLISRDAPDGEPADQTPGPHEGQA